MSLLIQIAYVMATLFYIASILIHVLILTKKLSYTLVNGGRSTDFEHQKKQSQSSILILFVFFVYVIISAFYPSFGETIVYLIFTSILVLFWTFGTILQFLGTSFEKRVVLWINLVGLVSHIMLLTSYFN